ncbi:MAG TPA: DNA recombination protein RmuC [candidate division Zixibacteria bacterium]|jgi:DNA recombination protein RmuC
MVWLYLIAGLLVGALGAWLAARSGRRPAPEGPSADTLQIVRQQIDQKDGEILKLRELYDTERTAHGETRKELAVTQHKLTESSQNLAEQRQFIEESKKNLADAFKALSGDVLKERLEEFRQQAGERQQSIDALIKPLTDSLSRYEKQIQELERTRQHAYGTIEEQLKTVTAATDLLKRETANLGQALRKPQVRGRWGELTLRRVAELAGMSERCDFYEQQSVDTDEGRQRPDMIVHLPGERTIVVDAKVPLVAFLDAVEAADDDERAAHLRRHTAHVRDHMKKLSGKAYWSQFDQTPDFVVMFIPGESFFSAAVDVDRNLYEEGVRSNVILSSPTTFIALLRTVALGWRQEQLTENAAQISKLGAELHERISKFVEHYIRVGKSLESATAAYNESVGSLESRVLVSTRKFRELGATAQPDIPESAPIERGVRRLQVELLTNPDGSAPRSSGDGN